MARIEDLYQEVIRQVEVLGRQLEQARHYKDKKSQLEALQTAVCARGGSVRFSRSQLEDKEKPKLKQSLYPRKPWRSDNMPPVNPEKPWCNQSTDFPCKDRKSKKVQTTIEHHIENRKQASRSFGMKLTAQQKREHELKEVLSR